MSAVPQPDYAEFIEAGGEPIRRGFFRIRDARGEWVAIVVRPSGQQGWEWEALYPNKDAVNAETIWVKAVRNEIDGETYRAMCPRHEPQRAQDTTEAKTMQTETLAIEQSAEIGGLTAALAKAQGEIRNATKDSSNPHFKSRYADLVSVVEACRPALVKQGIATVQMPTNMADGSVAVTTRLGFKGEWLQSTIAAKPSKFDAQGVGSVITYLRRYALAAMAGVAPEDDDGNGATGKGDPSKATNEVAGPPSTPPRVVTSKAPPADAAAAFWRRPDLRIAKGKGTWQEWQGRIVSALSTAPDIASLDRFLSDNGDDLNALNAENKRAYEVLMATVSGQQSKLALNTAAE